MAQPVKPKGQWGGPRPGSGRPPNPNKPKTVATTKVPQRPGLVSDAQSIPAEPRRQGPMFSEESVMAIIDAMREYGIKSRTRPRTKEYNPYIIRPDRIGPSARHLEKHKPQLAMDDSIGSPNQFAVQAWQTGAFGQDDSEMFLGYPMLAQMAQRVEFRLFGEIMSEEMTRKWIEFRGTDDKSTKEEEKSKDRNNDDEESEENNKKQGKKPGRSDSRNKEIERKIVELRQFCEDIDVRGTFKTLAQHDNNYGIGHLYFDLKGANIDNMRDPENSRSIGNGRDETTKAKLARGCLQGIRTIEPVWCYPTAYNSMNPLSRDFYVPQVWYVMGTEIHKTRLIPMVSRPVSDLLKPAYAFGGQSMIQLAQPYVDIWLRTRESVGELIHAFSIMVLATNMSTTTQPGGAGGGNGDVVARMMLMNMLRDNQGIALIDKATEDFKNISAPLSGLSDLQSQSHEHLCTVSRIPVIKYMGIQPKGLNATTKDDLAGFNDTVHGSQENFYRRPLTTLLDIAQISLWGERDPDITYDFLPLQEETPKEKAEIRKLDAETAQVRIDSGVIGNDEERARVVADPESGYHGLDPDDVPDLLEEEESGLIPPGAGKGLEAELEEGGGTPGKPPGGPRKKSETDNDEDE